MNERMNVHEPAPFVNWSAAFCPNVFGSLNGCDIVFTTVLAIEGISFLEGDFTFFFILINGRRLL